MTTNFHALQSASRYQLKRAPYEDAKFLREFMNESPIAPVGMNDSLQLYALLDHVGRVQYFDYGSMEVLRDASG